MSDEEVSIEPYEPIPEASSGSRLKTSILSRDPALPLWRHASELKNATATVLVSPAAVPGKAKIEASMPPRCGKPLPAGCCECVDPGEIHPVVDGHLCGVLWVYCPPSVYTKAEVFETCEIRAEKLGIKLPKSKKREHF